MISTTSTKENTIVFLPANKFHYYTNKNGCCYHINSSSIFFDAWQFNIVISTVLASHAEFGMEEGNHYNTKLRTSIFFKNFGFVFMLIFQILHVHILLNLNSAFPTVCFPQTVKVREMQTNFHTYIIGVYMVIKKGW